jgi:hypothetical protein
MRGKTNLQVISNEWTKKLTVAEMVDRLWMLQISNFFFDKWSPTLVIWYFKFTQFFLNFDQTL